MLRFVNCTKLIKTLYSSPKIEFNNAILFSNSFFTSPVGCSVQWRKKNRLEVNPNKFGSLTNLPDYTYLDGRPTPLGSHQRNRLNKQKEIAAKVIEGLNEIDFAVKRHSDFQQQKEAERQKVIANKLKPKGHLLLKKNNN